MISTPKSRKKEGVFRGFRVKNPQKTRSVFLKYFGHQKRVTFAIFDSKMAKVSRFWGQNTQKNTPFFGPRDTEKDLFFDPPGPKKRDFYPSQGQKHTLVACENSKNR